MPSGCLCNPKIVVAVPAPVNAARRNTGTGLPSGVDGGRTPGTPRLPVNVNGALNVCPVLGLAGRANDPKVVKAIQPTPMTSALEVRLKWIGPGWPGSAASPSFRWSSVTNPVGD